MRHVITQNQEPENTSKDIDFCHSREIYLTNIENIIIRYFQKEVHKTAEATEELIGNKTTETIVRPNAVSYENWRNVEEIIILPEKLQEILNELRQVL